MRRRFLGMATVVAALTSVVIGATPASAAAGWTVTPGGAATGTAGETILKVRPAGGGDETVLNCQSSVAQITAFSSTDNHVANIDDITFNQCLLAGLLTFDVDAHTPWQLNALSFADPVVSGEIVGISATISGPGCLAEVSGSVVGSYDNSTGQLTVDDQFTLDIEVDPVDNCFFLIETGDEAAFSGVYDVDPPQIITPA